MADKITVKAFLEKRREADKKLLAELAADEKSTTLIDEVKELVLFASNSTFMKLEKDRDAFQARYGVSLDDVLPDFRKPHVGLGQFSSTDFATLSESSYGILSTRYSFDTDNLATDYLKSTYCDVVATLARPVTVELTRYSASLGNLQENGLFTIGSPAKLDKPYRFDASAISLSPVTTRDSLVSDWTKSPYSVSASDKLYPFVEHHRVEHPSIQRPSTSIDAVVAMVEVLSPKLVTAITPSILSSVEYTIDRKLNDWAEQFRTYSHSWDKESVRAEIQAPDGHIIRLHGTAENIKSVVHDLFMGTLSKQESLQPKAPKTGKSRANDMLQPTSINLSQAQQSSVTVAKHEPMDCNKWLFAKYFDEGQTNLREHLEEWLHIRETKDFKDRPTNPLASMQTAISEEKRRRNRT